LKLHEKNRLYDDRLAADRIIEQWPQAGMTIKRGQSLRVNISQGPRPVKPEPPQPKPSQEQTRPTPRESSASTTTARTPPPLPEKPKAPSQVGGQLTKPEVEKKPLDAQPTRAPQLRLERSEAKVVKETPKEKKPDRNGSSKDHKTQAEKKPDRKNP
jgi:beta-lactam-binding protein with PASTA domain